MSGQCPLVQVSAFSSGHVMSVPLNPGHGRSVPFRWCQLSAIQFRSCQVSALHFGEGWRSMCLPHFSRAVSRCMGGNVVWLSLAVQYRAVGSVYRSTISTEVSPINPEDSPLPSFKTILYSVPWDRDIVNPRLSWEMTSECTYWQAFESSPVMDSWRRIALWSSSNCLVCHQFSLSQWRLLKKVLRMSLALKSASEIRQDDTLLQKDKALTTSPLFYKSVPDDKHSNTQYIKQEYN